LTAAALPDRARDFKPRRVLGRNCHVPHALAPVGDELALALEGVVSAVLPRLPGMDFVASYVQRRRHSHSSPRTTTVPGSFILLKECLWFLLV
jgi:hypothetical protein